MIVYFNDTCTTYNYYYFNKVLRYLNLCCIYAHIPSYNIFILIFQMFLLYITNLLIVYSNFF